jgi:4-carboxymuconolactone decarboxylase
MKILVTGGTGHVGSEVVKELQKRKADIRILVRKNEAPTPAGVEAVIGDLLDPVSVEKAMAGVDKLYLLNAVLPDELTQGLIAYDLAKKLKLSHVVYHSVFRVEHFKDVPHFASQTIVPVGAYYQKESSLTKAEIEIVTVLTNARWHSAYGTYEHEKIAEKLGHIPAKTTECLIAGLPSEFSDARQQVVYELACALVQPRIVPVGLYKRAKEALGDAGIVDVAVLIGWFTMVCMTLNAYDVPANATGLDQ